MLFSPQEERDDDSVGSVSNDSTDSVPETHNPGEESVHVTVSMQVNSDNDECKVTLESGEEKDEPHKETLSEKQREAQEAGQKEKDTNDSNSDLDAAIKVAREELEAARAENEELQRKILSTRQRRRSIVDADMLEGQNFLYLSNLARWVELKDELDQSKQKYAKLFDEMHVKLEKIQKQASDHEEALIHDLWQIAREAQNTVTGQILSDSVLNQLEERDRAATKEVSKVRIHARQLRSQLAKLEYAKRKKDQLPGGLHLVDFEQLKMETESLVEKIGAKSEEISVLRKKRTMTVHSLSHVREKLQHVEKETKTAKDKLNVVERDLHHGRIGLCNLKARCEQIIRKKGNMQRSMVNITDPLLLDDLENLKEDIEATQDAISELQTRWKQLDEQNHRHDPLRLKIGNKKNPNEDVSSENSSKHDLRWGQTRKSLWRQSIMT